MASRATLLLLLLVDEGDSGTPGSVQRSFVHMKVSNLFHGNVLPQYRWMCKMSGAEFAESRPPRDTRPCAMRYPAHSRGRHPHTSLALNKDGSNHH